MRFRSLRLADDVNPDAAGPIDLSGLAGTWTSADPATRGVSRLDLAVRGTSLVARVHGAGRGGEIDWGEAEASGVYADGVASAAGAGFVAHYDFGLVTCHVQAQLKLGVAVLGTFTAFDDGDGRRNYFSREFLAGGRRGAHSGPATGGGRLRRLQDLDFGTRAEDGPVDPARLLGRWRNADRHARGIVEVRLEPRSAGVAVRVRGTALGEDADWGETLGEAFACTEEDDVASSCVLARYDFGFLETELQVRQNKGILAVTTFNRFHDSSGRADYVARELFFRVER